MYVRHESVKSFLMLCSRKDVPDIRPDVPVSPFQLIQLVHFLVEPILHDQRRPLLLVRVLVPKEDVGRAVTDNEALAIGGNTPAFPISGVIGHFFNKCQVLPPINQGFFGFPGNLHDFVIHGHDAFAYEKMVFNEEGGKWALGLRIDVHKEEDPPMSVPTPSLTKEFSVNGDVFQDVAILDIDPSKT